MNRKMRTLLFGNAQECQATSETVKALDLLSKYSHESCCVDDLEELYKVLVDWEPSLLIVLADGVEGMEAVYCSRERRPGLPVFWFSDDRGFGMQSYRLNCAYFSTKPVTPDKLAHAIFRCDHVGICYTAV